MSDSSSGTEWREEREGEGGRRGRGEREGRGEWACTEVRCVSDS